MTQRTLLLGLFLTGISVPALAQTEEVMPNPKPPAPPSAVMQCRTASSAYQSKALGELRAAGTQLNAQTLAPISAEARRLTRACADKFSPDTLSIADLTALASIYITTADTAKATAIVATLVAKPGMTEAQRADVLISAEQLAIATFDPFQGLNPGAEKAVAEMDGLSDAVIALKIRAHQTLLGRYDYADFDEGILDHSSKLLVIAKRALATHALGMTQARPDAPSVDQAYVIMTGAYGSRARAAGDLLHADSALMILDEGERIIGPNYPPSKNEFGPSRAMYKLVGTKATPVTGQWWVNDKDGAKFTPGAGKVTLIQFTAHWCVPCRHSYPGMLNMAKHFAGKPYEAIMETYTYGFIGDKQKLTPAQEVAEDREYYAKHNNLPFKVAINTPPADHDTVTQDNERRYAVGGIPEIVVVDKKGRIRATVVGWDNGNEKRLTALIETLLAEK